MNISTAMEKQIARLTDCGWRRENAASFVLMMHPKAPPRHIFIRTDARAVVQGPGVEAAFDEQQGLRKAVTFALKL